jgi:hypothetical protein
MYVARLKIDRGRVSAEAGAWHQNTYVALCILDKRKAEIMHHHNLQSKSHETDIYLPFTFPG